MPIIDHCTINDVICVDPHDNKVMKSGIMNLKISCYDDIEINALTPDYKAILMRNSIVEFEYIYEAYVHHKPPAFQMGKEYLFKLYEIDKTIQTEFKGGFIKLERTLRGKDTQKYFMLGFVYKTLQDGLQILGGWEPKTYIIFNKNNNKLTLKKVTNSEQEREMILSSEYRGSQFFDLNKYLGNLSDDYVSLNPQNISHII